MCTSSQLYTFKGSRGMKLFLAVLLSLAQGFTRTLPVDTSLDSSQCPLGRFPCGNMSVCLPQLLQCNGAKDCKNGADEENCGNNVGWPMLLVEMFDSKKKRSRNKEKTANCTLVQYPEECSCAGTAVHCKGRELSEVPQILSNLTELNLKKNQIPSLRDNQFITYARLEKLFLQDNKIQSISTSAFAGLLHLQWLYLSSNSITQLEPHVFQDLRLLEWLILDDNNITEVASSVFVGLKSLLFLDLRNNALNSLPRTPICAEMPKLNWLDLEGNLLRAVQRSDFQGCSQLTVLVLSRNRIEWIQEGTFNELNRLVELDLSFNWLKELLPSTLKGLQELQQLNISNNPLRVIFPDEFDYVPRLRSLSMEGLEIPNIHDRMFEKLSNLSHIYLKKFHYCSFAPHVRLCKPHTDGISSFEHLLASLVLRVSVWLVACLICLGSLCVVCLRSFVVPESSTHTMAIKSLCFADCLTGIYLFLLGIFDLKFSGEYNQHAQAWMASLSCQLVGGVALLSFEVSVLLLTYMTLEKYLCIAFPFSCHGAGKRRALSTLVAIWLVGLALTLGPFFFFKNYYGTNGVCFPLQSDGTESPAARGYSAAIFLGLNLIAFICIVCAYTHMFYSIHTTAARTAERSVVSMDVTIAKRFFFIVFTNALCWIPIFLLKLLSLLQVDIPGTVTSWVVVFILPINSALNPVLYTITTTPFQEKLKRCLQKKKASYWRPEEQALPLYRRTPAASDFGHRVSTLEDDGSLSQ